jgi:hypothetical protein
MNIQRQPGANVIETVSRIEQLLRQRMQANHTIVNGIMHQISLLVESVLVAAKGWGLFL